MMFIGRAVRAAAVAVLAVLASGTVSAAGLPDAVKALVPAAQKEGKALVWGTTLNPRQTAAINKSFNAFYGINVKLTHNGGRHGTKANELAQAFRRGVPTGVDIFWTAIPKALIDAGALEKFNWTKTFGLDSSLDMGGYGLRTHHSNSLLITVNSNLMKKQGYPRDYDDLLKPVWRGKIAIPRSPYPWVMFSYAFGEQKAETLLRALLTKQNVKLLPRYPNVRQRVVSGEYALGLGTDAFFQIRKGAPVAHPPMKALVVNSSGAFLLKDSKSKNVAKLWGYWAVSPEGQETLSRVRGYSLVQTKGTDLNAYAQGKKLYSVPMAWRMKNQDRLVPKFAKIIKESR